MSQDDVAEQEAGPPLAVDGFVGLPAPGTSFVGREDDLRAVEGALAGSRMVNLLGPGGLGKTRLATAVAARYEGGGVFVDLVPVRHGYLAEAVGALFGVGGPAVRTAGDVVVAELARRRMLLVLDNCEHLADEAAALAARVLSDCPEVTVLATSRERLPVAEERVVVLTPLAAAGQLFLERARSVQPDFAVESQPLADLCSRLAGIPLAIELAAARVASLGADGLHQALDDRLRPLSSGPGRPGLQRTMRSVISWTHELLSPDEQALFRRLGLFVGGFDLAAATAVAGWYGQMTDLLGRLGDQHLLVRHSTRWRMPETIREYAAEQLVAAGEQQAATDRYVSWAAGTAERLAAELDGDWRPGFDEVVNDLRAAARLDTSPQLTTALARLTSARWPGPPVRPERS